MKPWVFQSRFFQAFWHVLRPLLGPKNVCIYPISCPDYAQFHLIHTPFYKAYPLITLRLLSCNPITGIIRWIYFRLNTRI